ncbi:hypothetical protein LBMAG53_27690 [Planctomycetota bacterium]|nr:hypothetical protein LBMAG53_27690 [Planctomycetota bacterium]
MSDRSGSTILAGLAIFGALMVAGCGDAPADPKQRAIRAACAQLTADAVPDRRRAVAELEKLLPPAAQAAGLDAEAIAQLRQVVADDRDDHVRAAAVRALGAVKDAQSWAAITARSSATEPQLRIEVLQALAAIDAEKARPLLIAALADGDGAVALVAASSLAQSAEGVAELIRRLGSNEGDRANLVSGLENSPLPAAHDALLAGLTSADSALRLAGIRVAARTRHAPSVPALVAIVRPNPGAKKNQGSTEEVQAAAEALSTIATPEALLALLVLSATDKSAEPLLKPHAEALQPIILAEAANPQRTVPAEIVVRYLLRDGRAEAQAALSALARPEVKELPDICRALRTAPAELRAQVAERLRKAIVPVNGRTADLLAALGHVGQAESGPDVELALGILNATNTEVAAIAATGQTSTPPPKGTIEPKEVSEKREHLRAKELLLVGAAQACARLKATAARPVFWELLASASGALVGAGVTGSLALGDSDSIERVAKMLQAPKVHSWVLMVHCKDALSSCHDPRMVPGLAPYLDGSERGQAYEIVASNGTTEAVTLMLSKLKDPAVPQDVKVHHIAPLMAGFGATGRPLFIAAIVAEPPPAKRGDPDPGWWCAEFLREQAAAAAPDVLAALQAGPRPTGAKAARFIHALELAGTEQAVSAQASWLNDADRAIATIALNSLLRQRRTGAIPAIRAALTATQPGPWHDRLEQALDTLSSPPKE